jgi:hypothetical protein
MLENNLERKFEDQTTKVKRVEMNPILYGRYNRKRLFLHPFPGVAVIKVSPDRCHCPFGRISRIRGLAANVLPAVPPK